MGTDVVYSGAIGERAEYHQGAADAGTPEPSIPLQFAVQLSGYRISVSFYKPSKPTHTDWLICGQVHRGGFNEWRRATVSHLEKDLHGRCSTLLDG